MIYWAPLVIGLLLAAIAAITWRSADTRTARRRALAGTIVATTLAGVGVAAPLLDARAASFLGAHPWLPAGLLYLAPLVTSVAGVVAVGVAPLATHSTKTFARVVLLFAIAQLVLAIPNPLVLALLWGASALTVWRELRTVAQPSARVFGIYQAVGFVSFATGAMLIWRQPAAPAGVVLLLLGIAIREGILPFHSWFPSFVERAPLAVVVAFAAPQLGVYAQLELVGRAALEQLGPVIATAGAVTALIAACLGAAQTKSRRAIAYVVLSQTGLVAFGLEATTREGLAGALLNWQVLALATGAFVMALAAVEARRGEQRLGHTNGNLAATPRLAFVFLVMGLSTVGFPVTLGFVAEDLLLQGTVEQFPILGIAMVIATAINATTVMRHAFGLFMGQRRQGTEVDLTRREGLALGVVAAALLVMGAVPGPIVSMVGTEAGATVSVPAEH